jgi:hypothetical protein
MVPRKRTLAMTFIAGTLVLGLYQNCTQPVASTGSSDSSSSSLAAQAAALLTQGVDPVCGNRVNNNGQCSDFNCRTVVELTEAQLAAIPARDGQGICYAYKVMSPLNGASNQTDGFDIETLARFFDDQDETGENPYQMGLFQAEVLLRGPRVIKAVGGLNANAGVVVDDFFLSGVFPSSMDYADESVPGLYKAGGIEAVNLLDAAGNSTGNIMFRGYPIPVRQFSGPYLITDRVASNLKVLVDLRALDSGGQRGLSDVYLFFQ